MNDDALREQMGRAAKESIKAFEVNQIVAEFYQFITKQVKQ